MDIVEEWRSIPNCSDYQASNFGRIRRLSRRGKCYDPKSLSEGYLTTKIRRDDGSKWAVRIHILVCLAWLGQCPPGHNVNHKNGVKTDNRIDNLEYSTFSGNIDHARKNGLIKPKRIGEPREKLTESDVKAILQTPKHVSDSVLAESFDCSKRHIWAIRARRFWKHVSL